MSKKAIAFKAISDFIAKYWGPRYHAYYALCECPWCRLEDVSREEEQVASKAVHIEIASPITDLPVDFPHRWIVAKVKRNETEAGVKWYNLELVSDGGPQAMLAEKKRREAMP